MTAAEIVAGLVRLNLVAAAAIIVVLILRAPVRKAFGAPLAYVLWLAAPLAVAAALLPAPVRTVPAPVDVAVAAAVQPPRQTLPLAPKPRPTDPATVLLLLLWLAGAAAGAGMAVVHQRRFLALAREGLVGPAVVGFLRPRLVLPADFEGRFTREEREVILAHEAAHLARHDSRLNTALAALQCAFWFNPLIHLAGHFVRIDQEIACDAAVVGEHPHSRAVYAQALLKTQLAATPLLAGCYWPARSLHPLNRRIAMLKSASPTLARRCAGAVLLTTASLGGGYAAWALQPPVVQTAPAAPAPVAQVASVSLAKDAPVVAPATTAETRPAPRPAVTAAAAEPAPRAPAVQAPQRAARETPQDRARRTFRPMPAEDVEALKMVVRRRVTVAENDLATAQARFDIGSVSRSELARAQLEREQALSSVRQLDYAITYLNGIREEHQVGLRTGEDVQRAEQQLMNVVAGSIIDATR